VHHHAILRTAVEDSGGVVFKTVGDGIYAVFSSASSAVAAALGAQQQLSAVTWGDIGDLKVRMGVQTGEAELQGEEYFGAALHRCARLTNAAHGGQILLSSTSADLVRPRLPAEAQLRDLGIVQLKDITRPEHVFQLSMAGLPTDFPALRTAGVVPINLPAEPTRFIGREHEIKAALSLLQRSDTRLLTLSGPGGIGKTRLGLRVAAESLDMYADGTFYVELAPIASPDLVMPTVAKIVGVPETANRPITASLKEHLKEKQVLLVLDNFEHVIAASGYIADLLSACPSVKALATSREALRVRGERQLQVPPLALPARAEAAEQLSRYEAVRLFVERAQAVKIDFALSDQNAAAIAEICRRLDGLPLALELAAARINVFSPHAMLARLERRLALLVCGPRDLPARQQTLRQAIAWSYDLLSREEQTVYRRLAVFAGGCTLDAAETVGGGASTEGASGMDVLAMMVSLVDKNLVRRIETSEEPRFAMLETIREYALERLGETDEAHPLRLRHAEYYLALAEEAEPGLIGTTQASWLDLLADEQDNFRAALRSLTIAGHVDEGLRLSAALRRFWRARGYISEGRERMTELLSLAAPVSARASRAKALHAAGWLAREQGDYTDARILIEESLGIFRDLQDPRGIGWALVDLGFITRYEGDYDAANSLLEESVLLLRQADDMEGLAAALGNIGLIARDRGDADTAETHLTESIALWRKLGDRVGYGWALTALGMVARARGQREVARERFQESLAVWRELNDRQNTANLLSSLARLACDEGEHVVARAHLSESLCIFVQIGDRRGIAFVLEGFASLASAERQPSRSICLEAAARALRSAIGAPAPPAWGADVQRSIEIAAAALTPEARATAFARGQTMTLPDATAFALDVLG
jgi:predicted ATPase